jgi:hypothetical protein
VDVRLFVHRFVTTINAISDDTGFAQVESNKFLMTATRIKQQAASSRML